MMNSTAARSTDVTASLTAVAIDSVTRSFRLRLPAYSQGPVILCFVHLNRTSLLMYIKSNAVKVKVLPWYDRRRPVTALANAIL